VIPASQVKSSLRVSISSSAIEASPDCFRPLAWTDILIHTGK